MIKTLVGLEAETFVLNADNIPVIASSIGLPHDNFPILCEIRGLPADNSAEVVSNFMREYYIVKDKLPGDFKFNLVNSMEIDQELYNKCIKLMDVDDKSIPKNIYGDRLDISNIITDESGKIIKRVVQAGLHIHVSCVITEKLFTEKYYFNEDDLINVLKEFGTCIVNYNTDNVLTFVEIYDDYRE